MKKAIGILMISTFIMTSCISFIERMVCHYLFIEWRVDLAQDRVFEILRYWIIFASSEGETSVFHPLFLSHAFALPCHVICHATTQTLYFVNKRQETVMTEFYFCHRNLDDRSRIFLSFQLGISFSNFLHVSEIECILSCLSFGRFYRYYRNKHISLQ